MDVPPSLIGPRAGYNRGVVKDRTGTRAVAFELVDTCGTTHTLERYRGRWLLLVFHRHLG